MLFPQYPRPIDTCARIYSHNLLGIHIDNNTNITIRYSPHDRKCKHWFLTSCNIIIIIIISSSGGSSSGSEHRSNYESSQQFWEIWLIGVELVWTPVRCSFYRSPGKTGRLNMMKLRGDRIHYGTARTNPCDPTRSARRESLAWTDVTKTDISNAAWSRFSSLKVIIVWSLGKWKVNLWNHLRYRRCSVTFLSRYWYKLNVLENVVAISGLGEIRLNGSYCI